MANRSYVQFPHRRYRVSLLARDDSGSAGSQSVKLLPAPGLLVKVMAASSARAMRWLIASPMPDP